MYLLHSKFIAQAEQANQLADILISASQLVAKAQGCKLYTVSKDPNEPNSVYVTEIWNNKKDHDDSLKLEGVSELIKKAIPILDGAPSKGQELEILGGAGI